MYIIKFSFIDSQGYTGMSVLRNSALIPRIGERIYISLITKNFTNQSNIQPYDCKVTEVVYTFDYTDTSTRYWDVEVVVEYSDGKIGKIIEE